MGWLRECGLREAMKSTSARKRRTRKYIVSGNTLSEKVNEGQVVYAYPWNDPAKKIEASHYCRWVFDDLFPQLAKALNQAHGEAHEDRYWRIIAGPWFFHRIEARYEKYVDPKNEFKSLEPIWMSVRPNGLIGSLKNAYAAILDLIGRTRPIILCDLKMSHLDAWRICLATRFRAWPMLRRVLRTKNWPMDEEARIRLRRFRFDWGKDEFSNLILERLAEDVPVIYVEHYSAMREMCEPFIRGNQKLFVSGAGWKSNERLKFIAARSIELGAHIAGVQHGGNTGWNACCPMDGFIRETVDKFLTWGIVLGDGKSREIPYPKFQHLIRDRHKKEGDAGEALFVGTSYPRYASAGIRTQPMSGQLMDYMDWQTRFFRAAGDLRDRFLVRTYPADYGWMNKVRLLQDFPKLKIDHFGRGIIHHLKNCRLAVIDNPQTTFLEALAMDKPCVLYFDPELWKMNPEAEARFKSMSDAGIVHFTPESAAEFVVKIYADPLGWWNKSETRNLRESFIQWTMMLDRKWPKAWAEMLMELAR